MFGNFSVVTMLVGLVAANEISSDSDNVVCVAMVKFEAAEATIVRTAFIAISFAGCSKSPSAPPSMLNLRTECGVELNLKCHTILPNSGVVFLEKVNILKSKQSENVSFF